MQLSLGLSRILFLFLFITFSNKTLSAEEIYFAGGCFWCTEESFQSFPGVTDAISGYCNGDSKTASYGLVSTGKTDHKECSKIVYDKEATNLKKLVIKYIQSINPMDLSGQFSDRGNHYKIEIYYQSTSEKKQIESIINEINQRNIYPEIIKIPIKKYKSFFPAEKYHQDYFIKNPTKYKMYKKFSGRSKFLKQYIKRFNK